MSLIFPQVPTNSCHLKFIFGNKQAGNKQKRIKNRLPFIIIVRRIGFVTAITTTPFQLLLLIYV